MLVDYFSHEIRTPLNSVLMGLQVIEKDIKRGNSSSDALIVIDEVYKQCDSAVDILNDLLLYERLEEGIIDLNMKPVPIRPFIKKKVDVLLPKCSDKKVTLNILLPDRLPMCKGQTFNRAYCKGDEDKLGRVLRTLLSNAIECTPTMGSITVKVHVLSKDVREESSHRRLSSYFSVSRHTLSNRAVGRARTSQVEQMGDVVVDDKWTLQIQITDSGPGMTLVRS